VTEKRKGTLRRWLKSTSNRTFVFGVTATR